MEKMNPDEINRFLMKGTFTGKLGTINKDGSSHITPIWYILDENNYITFTTYFKSVKAKNLIRDSRISICVDDQTPPFSFVLVNGSAKVFSQPEDLLRWTTKISERYMGKELSLEYGKRNAIEGELLVKVIPTKINGQKNISN
ncbi:MAG TPA: PPOX class F420-dependent oxidoreductase [Candidatus Sulfopaludibacter sp.]|jgi:PPOX class probable F420-dependent enzyme|nr:PPOX class F420-dependent oxidoreductase [Candidatus Sulfopaludibacter sp.]